MQILIVDDSADIRLLLEKFLRDLGYEVLSASDGREAWEILKRTNVQFIISDWLMPEMDGLELCRKIRNANFDNYTFVILLTAKDAKSDLVVGMEAGADDFVVKPFNKDELRVRIKAGERILKLEKALAERNEKLERAYSIIRNDIESAAIMQKELLPAADLAVSDFRVRSIFMPCSVVAGDTFNYFLLDDNHLAFYLLDVAGHGIPAAMLSFTLSKTLSPTWAPGNPLIRPKTDSPGYEVVPPRSAVAELNERFQAEGESLRYFTMIYGIIELSSKRVNYVQAGHPPPIHTEKKGQAQLIEGSGFPVGIMPNCTFDEYNLSLKSGDRLFLYSDGITECTNSYGEEFSKDRLLKCLESSAGLSLKQTVEELEKVLRNWRGTDEFTDDISLVAIESL